MDYMTDTVLAQFPNLAGRIHVTPDSRKLIVLQDGKHGVDIIVMRITGTCPSPLRFRFSIFLGFEPIHAFPQCTAVLHEP